MGLYSISVIYDDHGFRMKHGGVARYFCELFRHFSDNVKVVLPFNESSCYYLQQKPWSMGAPQHDYEAVINRWFFGFHVLGVWTAFMFLTKRFPRIFRSTDNENDRRFICRLTKRDYDVVHLTEAHLYGEYWKSVPNDVPLIVTVHDLIPELIWHREEIRASRREILTRATKVIAVSEFTKSKIIEQYAIPDEKIIVVHHGHSESNAPKTIPEYVGMQYLLYVGKRDEYKRFEFFLKAVASILHERTALHLICTGDHFSKVEKRLIETLGIATKVHTRFATDNELLWLYHNAKAFVYPSIMEGFGLPILEAFSAGCPVILSNSSCFPEIADDAALYFKPDSASDLQEKIGHLLDDTCLAKMLRDKGRQRLQRFSWEKCARSTEQAYQAAIKEK